MMTYLSVNNGPVRLLIIYKTSDNTMSPTSQCLRQHNVSENTSSQTVQVLDSTAQFAGNTMSMTAQISANMKYQTTHNLRKHKAPDNTKKRKQNKVSDITNSQTTQTACIPHSLSSIVSLLLTPVGIS